MEQSIYSKIGKKQCFGLILRSKKFAYDIR